MLTLKNKVIGRTISRLVSIALFLLLFFQAITTFAQDRCWTTAGSAGTVDESSLGNVELNPYITSSLPLLIIDSSVAGVKKSVTKATVNIYYNVVAVEGVFGGQDNKKDLTVRFVDNGMNSQVIVKLKRKDIFTGTITDLATLDSNSTGFTASTSPQTQAVGFNLNEPELNFAKNIYYIEVSLIKTGVTGDPRIHAIQICKGTH